MTAQCRGEIVWNSHPGVPGDYALHYGSGFVLRKDEQGMFYFCANDCEFGVALDRESAARLREALS